MVQVPPPQPNANRHPTGCLFAFAFGSDFVLHGRRVMLPPRFSGTATGDEPDRPQRGKQGGRGVAAVEKRKDQRECARSDFRAPQQGRVFQPLLPFFLLTFTKKGSIIKKTVQIKSAKGYRKGKGLWNFKTGEIEYSPGG